MKNNMSNRTVSKLFIELLYKKGVRYACISPGSRNMPLSEALLNHGKIKCYSYIDERAMCYFAVGLSKRTNEHVAVITTSGTAAANLFPGIIEARANGSPLLIITADRPKRLIFTGAPQTINQNNLFGKHVKCSLDIEHKKTESNSLFQKISECIDKSILNSPGPIHINFRFDEPLYDKLKNQK